MTGILSRRQLLCRCALLSVASTPLLQACSSGQTACVEPDSLSRGEEQMRETLGYVELSVDSEQQCSNCEFFHGGDTSPCGKCELLAGQVALAGYCSSWAKRG